jgi:surface protein
LENEELSMNCKEIKNEENFKELNENNTELYINSKKKEFKEYFIPSLEEGDDYIIELIIKNRIKNCNSMFRDCHHIISIDLSSFDASDVKDMSAMFCNCYNLKELNLANLNTKNVENMKQMFQNCNSLEKIDFPSSFTTENVKDISLMFIDCHILKDLNLSFDTHKVENMKGVFKRCYNLTKIDLSSFKTDKVKKMTSMFDECTKLEKIIFGKNNFNTKSVNCMGHMFNNCFSLKLS